MYKNKLLSLFLALAVAVGLLAGCGPASADEAPTKSAVTQEQEAPAETDDEALASEGLVDMAGRQITLEGEASRIVALMPADCEILYALGVGDQLVGRGEYCDWPAEILELEAVQSGGEMNLEQIIALEPDVVVMSVMAQTVEQVEALAASGVTVVCSDAQDIAGVYTAIELLGAITGQEAAATALAAEMRDGFAALADGVPADADLSVYFEVSPLEYGLWTTGEGTFMQEIADLLGLENIFGDVQGWAEVSQEQVIDRNPDVIVTTTMYFGEGPEPVDEIMQRDGWADIAAVQNGRVFNADSDEMTRPGPRLVSAAEALYAFVYEG